MCQKRPALWLMISLILLELYGAAKALKGEGAEKVLAYITHPVLSGKAYENIKKSMLDEIIVTDTIPLHEKAKNIANIRQISVSEMLAEQSEGFIKENLLVHFSWISA